MQRDMMMANKQNEMMHDAMVADMMRKETMMMNAKQADSAMASNMKRKEMMMNAHQAADAMHQMEKMKMAKAQM